MIQATIHIAKMSDFSQIKPLIENIFGTFPNLEEIFSRWVTQDTHHVIIAKIDSKIVGMSTWCVKKENDFSKYNSFGTQALEFMKSHKLAWAVNLAVYPQYRKNKIGQKLSLAQIQWLKQQDCTAVVGSSWVNGSDDHSQHLYLKAGFKKLGESKDFLRLQLQNGAICSVCKTPECNCNSILFGITTAELFKVAD